MRHAVLASLLATALFTTPGLRAQEQVLNLYSARHYQTDEALYANFTKATGIKINRIEADDAGILQRLKTEGAASPADVILLVDAARLTMAEREGLFQPFKSSVLEQRIPAQYRAAAGPDGVAWWGLSTRARMVVYNKLSVDKATVSRYEDLADPRHKGKVCTRSGSHPYNLSLFASLHERLGAARLETWLKGVVGNMARAPKGGDTDQIKAVASGECQIALTNSYYLARLMRSNKPEDRELMEKVGWVMPNQADQGTHLNIAGGAMAKNSKNRAAAQRFLEYLSEDAAQAYFADGNNEWPVVTNVRPSNPALQALGDFKREPIHLGTIAPHIAAVQQMLDRAAYK
ncbi:iron(III) transport system substrate-binding protein [Inhella inkyongensis]|uniref:Iron(III) transport system substrate-binding protein n=1 Tax=Inhella inkyongensis TaxID=392593 RepID=A0A840S6B2_9BURK|nr:extracellular solute-binding protein [Inhella inkyongensis]MBB5205965.1 iron(III) transport system substrate-binding protein [Inhella inkyongensis]